MEPEHRAFQCRQNSLHVGHRKHEPSRERSSHAPQEMVMVPTVKPPAAVRRWSQIDCLTASGPSDVGLAHEHQVRRVEERWPWERVRTSSPQRPSPKCGFPPAVLRPSTYYLLILTQQNPSLQKQVDELASTTNSPLGAATKFKSVNLRHVCRLLCMFVS
jgi:hypothetical protein